MHRPESALAGFIDESIHTSVGLYAIGLVLAAPALSEERPKRKEAARARALAWLVQELPYQVRSVVLAEREANQDRHDRRVLGGLAGRPPRFEYGHAAVAKEPLLWVADVVVSSAAKALVRDEDPWAVGLGAVLSCVGCEPA
ncbi:hypothetical protein [Microbispora rosea]|uniref:hypothetical protein n=1 Tax=Microbispora rosea TaxID=58117 RepID=UPI003D90ADF7